MSSSSTTMEEKQQISESYIGKALTTKKYFMICESCFWCASYTFFNEEHDISKSIPPQDTVITKYGRCPACGTDKSVESLPISSDEYYKFDYNPVTGVILEFLR